MYDYCYDVQHVHHIISITMNMISSSDNIDNHNINNDMFTSSGPARGCPGPARARPALSALFVCLYALDVF